MKRRRTAPGAKERMIFDYYKQEREDFANLSRERTSLSLQFLVILGALSYAFFQSDSTILRSGISGVIVILGVLGLLTNVSLEREMRLHVDRARAARKALGFLEEYVDARPVAQESAKAIRQDKLYLGFMILLMLVGLVYALTLILE